MSCSCARVGGFAIGLHGIGIITLYNENPDGKFIKHSSSNISETRHLNILSLASSADDTYIATNLSDPSCAVSGDHQHEDHGVAKKIGGPAEPES